MCEGLEFLLAAFRCHVIFGISPKIAWEKALDDYVYVYVRDDGRLPIARAAERALRIVGEDKDDG